MSRQILASLRTPIQSTYLVSFSLTSNKIKVCQWPQFPTTSRGQKHLHWAEKELTVRAQRLSPRASYQPYHSCCIRRTQRGNIQNRVRTLFWIGPDGANFLVSLNWHWHVQIPSQTTWRLILGYLSSKSHSTNNLERATVGGSLPSNLWWSRCYQQRDMADRGKCVAAAEDECRASPL